MASETAVAEQDLVLTPPEPVKAVAPEKAAGLVPVDDGKKSELEARVDSFIDDLVAQDVNSPEFGKRVDAIAAMGQKEIRDAAGQSNRFLDRPVKAMGNDGVGADLLALRKKVEELDPSQNGKLIGGSQGFLSKLFGGGMQQYFRKYQSSQTHINGILKSLSNGKDELLMDNAAIDTERTNLWAAMGRLEQMIYLSKAMDAKIEDKANELDHTDPAKAKALRETALFYVRQRTQDLLTQMAVTVQGYLALDLVKKNNVELVKGVDRASTTTVSALRTAVTVAQALTNQKLVLDQITALNSTTAGLIDSTGALLKSQSAAIHEQAANSTIPVETLQRAFQNIYDTMDAIDTFKLKALDSMKTTVNTLSNEVEKSKGYIARAEGAAQNQVAGGAETFKLEAMQAVPTDVDRELNRIGGTLDRVRARTDLAVSGRNRQHRETEVVRRIGRIAAADGLILAGAIVFGLAVAPLGMMGAMLVALLLVAATLLFALMPASAPVNVEKLAEIPLKALPRSTERWLETQRPALPSPVRGLVDSIGVKLETLTPQLAALDEHSPAAVEVRKLVGEQLPELVKGYQRVPEPLRRVERNGLTPDQQLAQGLQLIDDEIAEMTSQLAQGDLDALATRGRYLQIKYQGDEGQAEDPNKYLIFLRHPRAGGDDEVC